MRFIKEKSIRSPINECELCQNFAKVIRSAGDWRFVTQKITKSDLVKETFQLMKVKSGDLGQVQLTAVDTRNNRSGGISVERWRNQSKGFVRHLSRGYQS
jgi:hypothetical protein